MLWTKIGLPHLRLWTKRNRLQEAKSLQTRLRPSLDEVTSNVNTVSEAHRRVPWALFTASTFNILVGTMSLTREKIWVRTCNFLRSTFLMPSEWIYIMIMRSLIRFGRATWRTWPGLREMKYSWVRLCTCSALLYYSVSGTNLLLRKRNQSQLVPGIIINIRSRRARRAKV